MLTSTLMVALHRSQQQYIQRMNLNKCEIALKLSSFDLPSFLFLAIQSYHISRCVEMDPALAPGVPLSVTPVTMV